MVSSGSNESSSRAHDGRIPELEGFRALLAWTVVASHILICCGWYGPALAGVSVLGQIAEGAVDLFILLSGFAITRLVLVEREPFRIYIWRRACRIVPAYWLALMLAVALNGILAANLGHLPPGPERDGSIEVCRLAASRFWIDFPLHLALLHGMVPFEWLPFAPFTFLGAAWSLSLEWQFYCIAPFAVWLAIRHSLGKALVIGTSAIALLFAGQIMATFSDAFLPAKSAFFVVGGITYVALCRRGAGFALLTLPTILLAIIWWKTSGRAVEAVLTLAGWLIVIGSVRWTALAWVASGLNSAPLQYLGRVSYSTYLFHAPVLTLVQAAIWHWLRPAGLVPLLIWTTVGTAAGTFVVSALSWRFVERPFQRFARRARMR